MYLTLFLVPAKSTQAVRDGRITVRALKTAWPDPTVKASDVRKFITSKLGAGPLDGARHFGHDSIHLIRGDCDAVDYLAVEISHQRRRGSRAFLAAVVDLVAKFKLVAVPQDLEPLPSPLTVDAVLGLVREKKQ